MTRTAVEQTPVVVAGVHGHGRWHLENLERLARAGGGAHGIHLAGICDPLGLPPAWQAKLGAVPTGPQLGPLLEQLRPAVAIICTPIHTHTDLTLAAVAQDCDVLLEKPPAPTLDEFVRLEAGVAAAGRACQVGFQSLGSEAIGRVRELVADGAIGEVTGIGAVCVWVRDSSYYARSRWAGRRQLDGVPVVDGALTNPFAHAVATALALDGSDGPGSVTEIEVELYRANDIEADDTSCVRMRTRRGTTVVVAATLCGEQSREPVITVRGTRGEIRLLYKRSEVHLRRHSPGAAAAGDAQTNDQKNGRESGQQVWRLPSHDLLENLVAHVRDPAVPLHVPLVKTWAFMQVVEAVRAAPEPLAIGPDDAPLVESGAYMRRRVRGIDDAVARCAQRLALFSEVDLPWASTGQRHRVRPDDVPVESAS